MQRQIKAGNQFLVIVQILWVNTSLQDSQFLNANVVIFAPIAL